MNKLFHGRIYSSPFNSSSQCSHVDIYTLVDGTSEFYGDHLVDSVNSIEEYQQFREQEKDIYYGVYGIFSPQLMKKAYLFGKFDDLDQAIKMAQELMRNTDIEDLTRKYIE